MGELWKCGEEKLTSDLNLKRLKRDFNEATYRQLRIHDQGLQIQAEVGKIWKIMKHLSRHVAAPKNTCRVPSADHSRASFLNSFLVAGSWNQKDVMTVDVLDRSVPLD